MEFLDTSFYGIVKYFIYWFLWMYLYSFGLVCKKLLNIGFFQRSARCQSAKLTRLARCQQTGRLVAWARSPMDVESNAGLWGKWWCVVWVQSSWLGRTKGFLLLKGSLCCGKSLTCINHPRSQKGIYIPLVFETLLRPHFNHDSFHNSYQLLQL